MRSLRAVPLSAEAFAPFGDVVSARTHEGRSANAGTALRVDHAAGLENLRPQARINLAVFTSNPQRLPLEVRLLERHPCSSQLFLPLRCARYLVCVAPTLASGAPDVAALRAFVCESGQGINYRPGVWHHPMVALDGPAELAMLVWEDGSTRDCEEHPLPEPLRVE